MFSLIDRHDLLSSYVGWLMDGLCLIFARKLFIESNGHCEIG